MSKTLGFAYPHDLEPGDLIEYRHQAARVVEVWFIPEVDWDDVDRSMLDRYGPRPFTLVVQFVGERHPRHFRFRPGLSRMLRVLPEHYAVCVIDGELMPCAHTREDKAVAELAWELDRICGHCQKVIENGHMEIRVRVLGDDGSVVGTSRYHGAKRHRHCRAAGTAALLDNDPESMQLRWLA